MTTGTVAIDAGADEVFDTYVALPDRFNGHAMMVFHEIFGVNEPVRALARRYAADGYLAFAPDLLWRVERGVALGYSREETLRAMAIAEKFDETRGLADIGHLVAAIRRWPAFEGRIGALGLCMGGTLAFLAASELDIDAAVSFYGTALEQHLDTVPRLRCPVMLHYGGKDRFVSRQSVDEISQALAARSQAEVFTYPDADHGFYTRGRPQDIALAHERTAALLTAAFAPR